MAPSSEAASATALQGLSAAVTIPYRVSLRGQTTSALMDIECVTVRRSTDSRDSRGCYTIEMFESASKSRIPTMRSILTRTALSVPTVTAPAVPESERRSSGSIERKYNEFVEMRGRVFDLARHAHSDEPCMFCATVLEEIVFGGSKPSTFLKLLGSEDKIAATLTKSINSLLATVKADGVIHNCSGQDSVRRVLFDFLFTQDLDRP